MRLFFALPLPDALKKSCAAFQDRIRAQGLAASWPKPDGLHLTLAFLGEIEESRVPHLLELAEPLGARHPALAMETAELGGFPGNRSARVLWLGLRGHPELLNLAEDLRLALRTGGIPFDVKPFRAHLTLARFRVPQDIARFAEPPAPMLFEAREVALFQSVQTSTGAHYASLGRIPLGAP